MHITPQKQVQYEKLKRKNLTEEKVSRKYMHKLEKSNLSTAR